MPKIDKPKTKGERYNLKKTAKYRQIYFIEKLEGEGGIFQDRTRRQLLNLPPSKKRGRPKDDDLSGEALNQFSWQRIRDNIRKALVDLELFLEVAQEDQIRQVCNEESFAPITKVLFHTPQARCEPYSNSRAKIAGQFIEWGFAYLRQNKLNMANKDALEKAVDLSWSLTKDNYTPMRRVIT